MYRERERKRKKIILHSSASSPRVSLNSTKIHLASNADHYYLKKRIEKKKDKKKTLSIVTIRWKIA